MKYIIRNQNGQFYQAACEPRFTNSLHNAIKYENRNDALEECESLNNQFVDDWAAEGFCGLSDEAVVVEISKL